VVLEVELDLVTLPHADEAARHRAAERPERVVDAVGDRQLLLLHLELHDHVIGAGTNGGAPSGPRGALVTCA
jgi:hypothetical protein